MAKPKNPVRIHAAAFYFSHISRDLHEICEIFRVSEWAVRKWAKTQEWEHALRTLGYEGERSFITKAKRDTARDAGETFERAKAAYLAAMRAGEPRHKLATIAGDAVVLPRRRIHAWAQQYGWRDEV